jgi:hypothetical protein
MVSFICCGLKMHCNLRIHEFSRSPMWIAIGSDYLIIYLLLVWCLLSILSTTQLTQAIDLEFHTAEISDTSFLLNSGSSGKSALRWSLQRHREANVSAQLHLQKFPIKGAKSNHKLIQVYGIYQFCSAHVQSFVSTTWTL